MGNVVAGAAEEYSKPKDEVQGYVDDKESMMADHQELSKRRSKLELDIHDLKEKVQGDRGN